MGIFQSVIRWLGCGTENEQDLNNEEYSNYFNKLPHHNAPHHISSNYNTIGNRRQNPGLVFPSPIVECSRRPHHHHDIENDGDIDHIIVSVPPPPPPSLRDTIYEDGVNAGTVYYTNTRAFAENFATAFCLDIEEKEEGHEGGEDPTVIKKNEMKKKRRTRKTKKKRADEVGENPNVINVNEMKKKRRTKRGADVGRCGRGIKHYNREQRILIVGDGDFSFSASLALAFGSAPYIIATSLNSHEFLEKNYGKALSNIKELRSRGSHVLHKIDATKLTQYNSLLGNLTFDRIIFNFPFAGFFNNLSRKQELRRHRRLVSRFLKNAKEMIREDGEIHISHKTNAFHADWNLEALASSHRLRLIKAVRFNLADYPGYNTKRGFGGNKNFDCNPSKTYKF